MNSQWNIIIRARAQQALATMKGMSRELREVRQQMMANSRQRIFTEQQFKEVVRFGNQMQWTGRSMEYNFTLPVLAAGTAAMKWAMDVEKAMTRVRKVYGDLDAASKQVAEEQGRTAVTTNDVAEATSRFESEITALEKAFRSISDYYGVAQSEVAEVGAAWAAAGQSGLDLAKSTDLTMKAMIIGDMEHAEATKALISIQAQYQLSTEELYQTLAQLNAVENATATSMADLITGFSRAAGTAAAAGIDTRHLAAYIAALTPAAGSAANAGNALKTIISRLLVPTKDAADVMAQMGINIDDASWNSMNATERFDTLVKKFDELTQGQKNAASSIIASRWQVNRFNILMGELANTTGFYQKALDATDQSGNQAADMFNRMNQELNAVLNSDPRKLQRMYVILQNVAVEAIQPLIPYIIYLADKIGDLARAFGELDPVAQKWILMAAVVMAAIGPLFRYIGALTTLLNVLKFAFMSVARLGVAAALAMAGPWGIAAAAVIAAFLLFKDEIIEIYSAVVAYINGETYELSEGMQNAVDFIVNAFNSLPEGVQNALIVTVQIIRDAALAIYEWFSYINPFARHSPSLVDNVKNGVDNIMGNFRRLRGVKGDIKAAYSEIKKFQELSKGANVSATQASRNEDRKNLKKAGAGAALASYDRLTKILDRLNIKMSQLKGLMDAQQRVVDRWAERLERANDALDRQNEKLNKLQDSLQTWQDLLSKAEDSLSTFASAPIKGMGEMEDAIFSNQMAQTRLRYEMMKFEDVNGTFDELKSKIEAVNGAQEILRGTQAELRAAGAGSEILGVYDDQLRSLDDQKDSYQDSLDILADMQDALDELGRTAERLDLEKSLKFDELLRTIEKTASRVKEMSFEDIIAGIKRAQSDIDKYSGKVATATKKVEDQEKVVKAAEAARDRISKRLDEEQAKLDQIKDLYDATQDAISEIESTLNAAASAAKQVASAADKVAKSAKKASDSISPALASFLGAGSGNFKDKLGSGIPMRTDWSDQTEDIEAWAKKLREDMAKAFEEVNPFEPLIKWARSTWKKIKDGAKNLWDDIEDQWGGKKGGLSLKIDDFLDSGVAKGFENFWKELEPELREFSELLDDIEPALDNIKSFFKSSGGFTFAWVDALSPNIGKNLGKIAGGVAKTVRGILRAALNLVGGDIDEFWEGIFEIGKGVEKAIDGATQLIVDLVLDSIDFFFPDLRKDIAKSWNDMWAGWFKSEKNEQDKADKISAKWQKPFKDAFNNVGDFFENLPSIWDDFWDWVVKSNDDSKDWLQDIEDQIQKPFKDAWKGINKWLEEESGGSFTKGWKGQGVSGEDLKKFFGLSPENKKQVKASMKDFGKIWDGLGDSWEHDAGPIIDKVEKGVGSYFDRVGQIPGAAKWRLDQWWNPVEDYNKKVLGDYDYSANPIKRYFEKVSEIPSAAKWRWGVWKKDLKDGLDSTKTFFSDTWTSVEKKTKDWFNNDMQPELKKWGGRAKNAWKDLTGSKTWFGRNVFDPISKSGNTSWSKKIAPELKEWRGRADRAWDKLKSVKTWFANNVFNPIRPAASNFWTNRLKPELGKWRGRFESAWGNLTKVDDWFSKHVMGPIGDKIKSGWTRVRDWVSDHADWIVAPFKKVVKGVTSAVNWIIRGINKLDALPGVTIDISTITLPKGFAAGTDELPTRRANRGFMTRGARAIVGEGKANHPEFVIPTDPTYRQRAVSLLSMAAQKLGVSRGVDTHGAWGDSASDMRRTLRNDSKSAAGIPLYEEGGILGFLGKVGDKFLDFKGKVIKTGKDILGKTMNPFIDLAKNQTKRIGWATGRQAANGAIDLTTNWLKGAEEAYGKKWEKSAGGGPGIEGALRWAKTQAGKPYVWGGVGPYGYDCSGFMSAITNKIRGKNPHSRIGATASFPWPGFSTTGPYAPMGFTIGSSKSYAGGVGHMAGTLNGVNVESRGGQGVVIGSAARGYMDSGFTTRASLRGLKDGGIVRKTATGRVFRLGEGDADEAVTPLPKNWKSDGLGGKKEFNMYGDFIFPNVKSGDDAKTFLDNLESLTKD